MTKGEDLLQWITIANVESMVLTMGKETIEWSVR